MEDKKPVISKNRILHMYGVAEYMYEHAPMYGLDPEEMYVLGLLHDIGYLRTKYDHEKNGSEILRKLGYKHADFVEHHGDNPDDYINTLVPNARVVPKEIALLWEADMQIDSKSLPGQKVDFDYRLEETKRKAGEHSVQYQNKKAKIDWLKENMKKYKDGVNVINDGLIDDMIEEMLTRR